MLALSCHVVTAQQYFVKKYRVEKGLPSDIIKGVTQDSSGYFWIATDEGLVKYDGLRFTSYRQAMRSNFAKGFFTTRSGRLFAFGDLDLIEIKNLGDSVVFESVCPALRIPNDTSLSYPKLLYEDVHGDIWVSESQSVVRLHGKGFTRYAFDLANRSPKFLRSFIFFEDISHELFVASFQGSVFRYNRQANAFDNIPVKLPPSIEYASIMDGKLMIGAADGIWEAELLREGGIRRPQLKLRIPMVSFVKQLHNGKYFIATHGHEHFVADSACTEVTTILTQVNNVNHVHESNERDIWISSNEGLVMMREDFFDCASEKVMDFIEAITQDPVSGMMYYATAGTLYSFDPATRVNRTVLDLPSGYFQSLVATREGIWVGNAFRVFLFSDGRIKKEFDFSAHGRFVTGLFRDSKGSIWISIPGLRHAYMVDSNHNLQRYRVPLQQECLINVIREGKDGMYIGSNGKDSYLFFKSFADTVFQNISAPLSFSIGDDFNVPDFAVIDDNIWLVSSEGLLKFGRHKTERVNLGDHFTGLPVRTIFQYSDDKLITANAFGMILYDLSSGAFDVFNEGSGLKSNTITRFFVDKQENLWVGTAKGLSYSTRPLNQLRKTPRPRFTETLVNGKKTSLQTAGYEIDHGSFLSVLVSSITFPENEVMFQYRLLPFGDWKTTADFELRFPMLQSGEQMLEVKAKKNGPYTWSDTATLAFYVSKPFWQQSWFYAACLVGIFLLIGLTWAGVNALNAQRNRELQSIVNERTRELQLRNEQLVKLNQEKNNLIGIVAHDLKSPLNQIAGLLSLVKLTGKVDDSAAEYLTRAEESTKRLGQMIGKILDIDAIESKQLNVNMEKLNVSEVVDSVVKRYDGEAARKDISITRSIEPALFINADRNFTEQVLENLLSNAIKFSPFDRSVLVTLQAAEGKVVCEIKDHGPGLSEADQKKLFGKYQKLSARPTGNETSTGLGLSIAKRFMVAMQGDIWCESKNGGGASFFVAFSRVREQ